ncbi:uncharacterized protein LOC118585437 isoform X3 [Onychomys torridus]|uniref:uncharacterized protein LOC118585437 isoform X3 n=1 Tax=Onychomys torridus TaxID=38674 RepID=UPI00167F38AB|nr:uncharacterized protein LOC118585437 isoform X3 [Onychomys torridus]XP_036045904.1 uncharacterized protein LOC118585437 isoform X3 [Onychomys torridus]XP_036045905.1 uncharacterized protein LOC118585437 isoform X3 [Onychomys torridus]
MDRRCYVSVSGTRSHPPLHKRRRAGRDPRRRQRRRRSHAPASPLRLTEARSSRLEAGSPIAHRWMSSEEARISGFGGDAVIPCHTDSSEKPTLLNGWTPNAPSMDSVMEKLLRWAGGCSTLPPSLCPVDVWTSDVQHHGQLLVESPCPVLAGVSQGVFHTKTGCMSGNVKYQWGPGRGLWVSQLHTEVSAPDVSLVVTLVISTIC